MREWETMTMAHSSAFVRRALRTQQHSWLEDGKRGNAFVLPIFTMKG